jgi:hypothetical protein
MMKKLLIPTFILSFLFLYNIIDKSEHKSIRLPASDKAKCRDLLASIFDETQGMLGDYKRESTYFYPGRTIRAFEATDPKVLERLFSSKASGITYDDFINIYWGVKSGSIKVTPQEDEFISDIHHMIDDHGPFLWRDQDKVFHILETLRKADANWSMIKGRDESALATQKALSITESNIIERALSEHLGRRYPNSRWFHGLRNFIFPHYKKIVEIISHNNFIRKRLQLTYTADEPFDHGLSNLAEKYKLSDSEISLLKEKTSDSGAEVADVRQDVQGVFGRELTILDPTRTRDVNVATIYKAIRNKAKTEGQEAADEFNQLYQRSNQDLDQLDDMLQKSYSKENPGRYNFFPLADVHDTHLKIRFDHFKSLTDNFRSRYFGFTKRNHPRDAKYNVTTAWTVTVHHSKQETRMKTVIENGKSKQVVETYTKRWTTSYSDSRPDVLEASYEEVLLNDVTPKTSEIPSLPAPQARGMHADYATNGSPHFSWVDRVKTSEILESGAQARSNEGVYRTSIRNAEAMINELTVKYQTDILTDAAKKSDALATLQRHIDHLVDRSKELNNYLGSNKSQVRNIWHNDISRDFQSRNTHMLTRIDHMERRLRHIHEQVLRDQPNLQVDYQMPDHSSAVEELRRIHVRYRVIQGVMAGTTVAAGGFAIYDLNQEKNDIYYQSKIKMLLRSFDHHFQSLKQSGENLINGN